MFDVVIVGGGPAGLSAALVLGRCRRSVLLCDSGHPRNAASRALHGYLTRDGMPPRELLSLGRQELEEYGIETRHVTVTDVRQSVDAFEVLLEGGHRVLTRTVLLATGVKDRLPDVPGLAECYGTTVHHCPYCDGWEVRDRRIVVMGEKVSPAGLALSLKTWSEDVVVCTNNRRVRIPPAQRAQLVANRIRIYDAAIERVTHADGRVVAVVLGSGEEVPCDAIFFTAPQEQHCHLARELGCEFTRKGTVKTDHLGHTCVPGIYVVGDASRDVQFVIVAAAEGAKAGVAINKALQERAGLAVDKSA